LDDREIGVKIPADTRNISLSSHSVYAGSGVYSVSYPMNTRSYFLEYKTAGGVKLTNPLHLVPRLKIRGSVLPHFHTFSCCGA
jgi:hypothetical protein